MPSALFISVFLATFADGNQKMTENEKRTLTESELENLKSQIVISNRGGG